MCSSGFLRPKPRISSRFSACRFMYTTPAAMNSVSLMSEWFSMCITLPYAASVPSSPSSTITDSPSVIKPI